MRIQKPEAFIGDGVGVLNYRRRSKENPEGTWEGGVISRAEYQLREDGSGWWHYTVLLDRKTTSKFSYGRATGNRPIWVYVSDDSVVKVNS